MRKMVLQHMQRMVLQHMLSLNHKLASPICFNLMKEHPVNAKEALPVVVNVCLLHTCEIMRVPIG
jgi:hypothetical protein